jgi:DNA invertase Pin-like site-specific DNA recombinase
MSERRKIVRCAVYTRKSTEHNLDLEFNSLHAQREACEAYIKSQMHEGWKLIPDQYDDGGISGASLDRPDLQRLLGDISAGNVDTVVVYKVDRLTRSLTDFAKLVELFDKHNVSFVSITQSFNTTTSMGRLTLNVLLSFAQFEREVIGERVRDKIAASKRKGMFMGGNIPLGYVNRDKKLIVVPEEADRVRWMFRRYLELGSVGRLLEEMNRLGIRTKAQTLATGRIRGGGSFGVGALTHILKNRCYVGELVHKGQVFPAEHEPVMDRLTYDAVQASLTANNVVRKAEGQPAPFLLTGVMFDSGGNRLTPSHSRKKGVRYRYYVSQAVLQARKGQAGEVCRVPAPDIEAVVERFLRQRSPNPQMALSDLVASQIDRVTVRSNAVEIAFKATKGTAHSNQPEATVSLPWTKKPFRAPKGIASEPSPALEDVNKTKEAFLRAVGRARQWVNRLTAGETLRGIAKEEGKGERQIRHLIKLAFVPPQIIREIVDDQKLPGNLTAFAKSVPLIWS